MVVLCLILNRALSTPTLHPPLYLHPTRANTYENYVNLHN